jgi:hypothetical protein
MRQRQNILVAVLTLVAATVLTGCAGAAKSVDSESTGTGITWLTRSLQDEGVFVKERGSASVFIPTSISARLILDGRDVLDVYEFRESRYAADEAYEFAERNPGADVFLRQALIVIRYSDRDTGLSQTLNKLLGRTL